MKYKVSKANSQGEIIDIGQFDDLEAAKVACRAAVDRDFDASVHQGSRLIFSSNLTNDWKRRVESNADGSEFSEEEIQSRNEAGW
jgi:hypothetical protein